MKTTVIKKLRASGNAACKRTTSSVEGDEGVAGLGVDDAVSSPHKRRKPNDGFEPSPEPFVVLGYDKIDGAVWVPQVSWGSSNTTVSLVHD